VKFFVDENLSPWIAEGLRAFREDVTHLRERFPEGTMDEIWIPTVASEDRVIITRDVDIKRHRLRSEIFRRHKAGAFVLRTKNASGWDLIRQIVWLWPEFTRLSERTSRPFMFAVRARGEKLERIL
jgi:predicted nuclease of predicted toxin-antitoxin system